MSTLTGLKRVDKTLTLEEQYYHASEYQWQ